MSRRLKFIAIPVMILLMFETSCRKSLAAGVGETADNIIAADPCDDPDAGIDCNFLNMPKDLSHVMTIAGTDAIGERLTISGTVFRKDGKTPYRDLVIYAYHTDSKGLYSKSGTERGVQKWHGKFHGWCKTDKSGRYQIETIRPARYPDNSMPAHIHAAVKNTDGKTYYISDFVFKDDLLVNDKYLSSVTTHGGNGVMDVQKQPDGKWAARRDIVLPD